MPSELTPARRGAPPRGHGRGAALTKKGPAAKSIFGFGSSNRMLGGISSCWSASTVLIRPVTPAARSRWPKFDFTEPIGQ
jgi:hypothetical protein